MRVSADQIHKFDFKFERKTIRRSIFSSDERACVIEADRVAFCLQLRDKAEVKELPFSFFRERKGILLTKRRPFLSQALSNPTARERLLRYAQFYLALSRRKFLNLRFRDAGLGGQNLKPKFTNLTLNLNLEIKAKYFEMDLNVVRKFSSQD